MGAADSLEPSASPAAGIDDPASVPLPSASNGEGLDASATSRKRDRNDNVSDGPWKQAHTNTVVTPSPYDSRISQDNPVSSSAPLAPPLTGQSSGDSAGASPKAPITIVAGPIRKRRNKRKAQNKGRQPPPFRRPPAEEEFVRVISKAAQTSVKALEAEAIATDPAVVETVLYRPPFPAGTLKRSSRLSLAAALATRPCVAAVCVNHWQNIVAVDASTPSCLSDLLTIKPLNGVPVTAREPADRRTSVGFQHWRRRAHGLGADSGHYVQRPGA
ncbi:hypothetical protein MTO96_035214 [Rhipicephalus appendiculatus]